MVSMRRAVVVRCWWTSRLSTDAMQRRRSSSSSLVVVVSRVPDSGDLLACVAVSADSVCVCLCASGRWRLKTRERAKIRYRMRRHLATRRRRVRFICIFAVHVDCVGDTQTQTHSPKRIRNLYSDLCALLFLGWLIVRRSPLDRRTAGKPCGSNAAALHATCKIE